MRKITPRDWLALAAPAIMLVITAFFIVRDRGWLSALIVCGLGVPFVLWQWRSRIRKYPVDTWRARL
ncbi:hypothetical protein MZO42_05885 [Sphingomonas psychrotolerans]|uniref:Uncharacterized protein n=1 Tax=Sphingomonas psychrotolerans TaxID=1327635 RepID=A0ABU3N3Y9_9SPHN|nr:hypothetical protein [Sphingomonas psychrotolerans]MDT8758221.1 hypothetical protein [Sphingomonas psychrotolerans]